MGIAALWICIFHEWIPLAPGIPVLGFIEGFVKQIGFFGVDLFLLLSGMGLTHAIGKYNLPTFYKRRLLRVLPPYALMATVIAWQKGWSVSVFLRNLFGITFFAENMYALLWFVPAITVLYLLFPLYYALMCRTHRPTVFTGCALILWLTVSLLVKDRMRLDLFGFTNRIPIFLTGILLGHLHKNGRLPKRTPPMIPIHIALFIIGLVTAYLTNYRQTYLLVPVSNCCVPNFLLAVSGAFLFSGTLGWLSHHTSVLAKGLIAFLGFFGTVSLEFYCVQELIGERLHAVLQGTLPDSVTNAVTLLAITLAAVCLRCVCLLITAGGRNTLREYLRKLTHH